MGGVRVCAATIGKSTMNRHLSLLAALVLAAAGNLFSAPLDEPRLAAVRESLGRGASFLLSRQQEDGSWFRHPAITALVCMSLIDSPQYASDPTVKAAAGRGLDFVVRFAKADGSIWAEGAEQYPNYCTAVSLVALAAADRPGDRETVRRARDFLMSPASQFSELPETDPSYGGIGYGKRGRPDLSNTQWALEALAMTDHLDREPLNHDPEKAKQADLAWERARVFLANCQNLAETNQAAWVMSDPANRGGFIYMPGGTEEGLEPESKAGEGEAEGRRGLRSYGSMTYAGFKSMLYAKIEKDDVRVQAAFDWIRRHFTFAENPGVGPQGHFYFLHTAAKALHVFGEETVVDMAGTPHAWRRVFVDQVLAMQKPEGFWVNDASARWMEGMPELTTAYAMMALEIAAGGTLK